MISCSSIALLEIEVRLAHIAVHPFMCDPLVFTMLKALLKDRIDYIHVWGTIHIVMLWSYHHIHVGLTDFQAKKIHLNTPLKEEKGKEVKYCIFGQCFKAKYFEGGVSHPYNTSMFSAKLDDSICIYMK